MMLSLFYMVLFFVNQYHTLCNNDSRSKSVCLCGFQNVSVTFFRYRGKYLLRRISYPSNGSFNPYAISNKEAHIVNRNIYGSEGDQQMEEKKYLIVTASGSNINERERRILLPQFFFLVGTVPVGITNTINVTTSPDSCKERKKNGTGTGLEICIV